MSAADGGVPASGPPMVSRLARWVARSLMLSGWSHGRGRMVMFWSGSMVLAIV